MLPRCRSNDSDFEVLIGQEINSGKMRRVYKVDGYTDFIIKEDTTDGYRANETEAAVYFTAIIKNFQSVLECIAEIRSISQSGKYLIMEKLDTNIPNSLRPDGKIPDEVSDNKLENFGTTLNDKKIKCLDYALLKNGYKPTEISGNVRSANLPTDQFIDEMMQNIESVKQILNGF